MSPWQPKETAAVPTEIIEKLAESEGPKKQNGKDLTKTKLCSFGRTGSCRYGAECIFAHSMTELRSAPDLTKTQLCTKYSEGKCTNTKCSFAHGEEELRDRPTFKKKQCAWFSKGLCRNGVKCGFAHGSQELRQEVDDGPPGLPTVKKPLAPPPGLCLGNEPPGLSTMKKPVAPEAAEKSYFKMMAGRGASPLAQQVEAMTGAILGLQAKLSQLESMMMDSQVKQMQSTILELTKQCDSLQAGLGMEAQAGFGTEVETKSRLNAKAAPFVPNCESDDSTSVPGSE